MNEDIFVPDEILDDEAFLKSLDALLGEASDLDASSEPAEPPVPEEAPVSEKSADEKTQPGGTVTAANGMPILEMKPAPKDQAPKKNRIRPILFALFAAVLLGGCIYGFLLLKDPYRMKILPGVTVGTVDLSQLSRRQAKKALDKAYRLPLSRQDMVVTFPEDRLPENQLPDSWISTLEIPASESGAHVDTAAAVEAAYAIGRTAETENRALSLSDFLTLNEALLQELTKNFADNLRRQTVSHTAYLEGTKPDVLDPKAEPQTLVITPSQPAPSIDEEALYSTVLEAYRQGVLECTYTGPIGLTTPDLANLQEIYDANCFPPQEPTIDGKTLKVTPGKPGYVFDVQDARARMLHQTDTDLRIPLTIVQPTISDEDVYFLDVLGHCETPHGTNEKRNTNLRIACAALDGLVLQPGQEFSYNETLGERTADKGYMPAPSYSGTTLVDSLGGGICQVSSTLYLASVYAELTILERVNHGYPVSYIPLGMDATVNWGFTDLKMRNDSPLPVKIHAEESDGYVRIDILGTETRDYDIKMTYSVGGRHVRSYKTKYDKETGEALGPREQVALSAYMEDIYKQTD